MFPSNRLYKLKKKLAKLHPEGEQYEPQSHYEGTFYLICFEVRKEFITCISCVEVIAFV